MKMDYVSLNIEDHIGIVSINKPPANNYNIQLYQEVMDTFQAINANKDVWVVVLRAEGKHFCAGNDVKDFINLTDGESASKYAKVVSNGIGSVYTCEVPVIGAIQGKAIGAGTAMASCCDILIASETARFGIPEITVGIVGGACFVSRILPQQLHRYMAFSGDMIMAEQLKHYGAVMKVVAEDQLFSSAMEVARRLANNAPRALRGFKAAINTNESAHLEEKYALEIAFGNKYMIGTEDFKEAVSAFMEKRKPVFKAR